MNNNTQGIFLTFFICCLYPLIVHFGLLYGLRWLVTRDWKNIQWQNLFKLPWSKEE